MVFSILNISRTQNRIISSALALVIEVQRVIQMVVAALISAQLRRVRDWLKEILWNISSRDPGQCPLE